MLLLPDSATHAFRLVMHLSVLVHQSSPKASTQGWCADCFTEAEGCYQLSAS